ncbi:hypothetical protein Patl1_04267 [Pistacia atlantica]|uniref:Uncharacterized protein n=1 Tax=Pistacia atlantica TaxID=434234 RepID=A0ACC1BW48_9ROSI|nr:hypothetical protein Patl1_04267 [Pistacia atlantica]
MVNVLHQISPATLLQCSACSSPPVPISRGISGKTMVKCSFDNHMLTSQVKQILSGIAASIIVLSQTNQVGAAAISHSHNICQLASAADNAPTLPIDQGSDGRNGKLMMMRGMTAKNFDPVRYSGRWFEVASLKRGFAGQGQEDCHCTQGVYTFDMEAPSIQVDTFCVHGGPDGYITGIRGKEPYDVIATDYDNFSLVSGAKDRSFIQLSGEPHILGIVSLSVIVKRFLNSKTLASDNHRLTNTGLYTQEHRSLDVHSSKSTNLTWRILDMIRSKIKDTPQDCEVMSNSKLAAMMSMPGMQQALTNQFPDLELKSPIAFDPFTSVFDTLKKLVQLYFKQ